MPDLDRKIVLVTGASGGLGKSVTEGFLRSGATVIGSARSLDALGISDPRFVAMPADLSSAQGANQLISGVIAKFGRIDVLAHLVGGFDGGKPVHETADETLNRMFDLNLKSAFYVLRATILPMRAQGGGRIIAIGSRAAVEASPGASVYAASKAALVSLIRTIAAENKDRNISANIVLPGMIDTAANRKSAPDADFSKWVQPEQIAHLLVSLASDSSSQISGAVIPIYGSEL